MPMFDLLAIQFFIYRLVVHFSPLVDVKMCTQSLDSGSELTKRSIFKFGCYLASEVGATFVQSVR